MTVSAAILPKESALWAYWRPGDFIDCYKATGVPDGLAMDDAVHRALGRMPRWVALLMDMRNRIVGRMGLKAGRHSRKSAHTDSRVLDVDQTGERIAFTVRERRENEIILGEDDKHLDFRISIYRGQDGWYVATWVHPNAWYGWAYLYTILPFHKLIMRLSATRLEMAEG